jgi:hypothetical protein
LTGTMIMERASKFTLAVATFALVSVWSDVAAVAGRYVAQARRTRRALKRRINDIVFTSMGRTMSVLAADGLEVRRMFS